MPLSPRLLRPRASATAGAFDPRSIAGLGGWWDAMDSSTLTTGTGVSEWRDKSGLGQAFSQATTGSQPALTASAISGRPGVTFNVGRFLDLGSQTIGGNNLVSAPGNPWSIYIVCRSTDNSALVKTLFGKGQSQLQLAQNTAGSLFAANGASPSAAPAFPANVNGLFTFDYNGSFAQMRFNDGISTTSTPTSTTNEAVNVALGIRNASSPIQHFVGHIGEVIFYNRSLNASERSSVVNYLSNKWGFAIPQYSPPTYADADANAYITSVEFADTLALEPATRDAINDFVVGCKTDGIWSAIKASCVLAGARTLQGALTPLVGPAPTNNGPFVSGDYNRRSGLVGNGASKYLNTNRNHNLDPQNNHHAVTFVTTAAISGGGNFPVYVGAGGGASGVTNVGRLNSNGSLFFRSRTSNASTLGNGNATGLIGVARSIGSSYTARFDGADTTVSQASSAPYSGNYFVFGTSQDANPSALETTTASNARLAFYSIGQFIDLALLGSRVAALYTALRAATIPQVANAEAQDWLNRVYDNGGTVSATTAAAVNTFCNSIDAESGLRAAILRLNLFCGNSDASLNAVRTPLYRGASLTGTQFGNATDTNNNFVQGDYQETGSSGGLKGNGSTKWLGTGFAYNNIPSASSTHLSMSGTSLETVVNNKMALATFATFGNDVFILDITTGGTNRGFRSTLSAHNALFAHNNATAESHMIGTRTSTTATAVYRGGALAVSNTSGTATPATNGTLIPVFAALDTTGTITNITEARLRMYSIGNGLTASQALAFSNAVIAFNTALGRA